MSVHYQLDDGVATITMDDGKVNALSPAMIRALNDALDTAVVDQAGAIVLAGRDGVFSGGFDLPTLRAGGSEALGMLRGGFHLADRLLGSEIPIVTASHGHAIAMGLFLLLSADHVVGAVGEFNYTANEVAIGLTVPLAALEVLGLRLSPAALGRVAITAEPLTPDRACAAGILDQVVPLGEVLGRAQGVARRLLRLDRSSHAATKARVRDAARARLRAGIDQDFPPSDGEGGPAPRR